jgi:hypothetical protein
MGNASALIWRMVVACACDAPSIWKHSTPMKCTSEKTFSQLRISRAYLKLLSIPENVSGARVISLERIGSYQIRMFEPAQIDSADGPLFWLELFDGEGQSSVDSCSCHAIEEAVTVFDGFVEQANELGTRSQGGRDEPEN